ncbi:unnamed protein product [Mycena citricolor]|uniref:C3H1-type domain-containing protein n=1 Tax=Mycena citricolor TaxID=2018698 RepID=A0AAD2K659_9AGAR|nr:unnamed protein product [Mycena citricolor]
MDRTVAHNAEAQAEEGERLKNLGNDLFRQGKYAEAAKMYNEAIEVNGTQTLYMSNLAATYLKLEDFDMAERAASTALLSDPKMVKARFRRAMARKGASKLLAAKIDLDTVLELQPSCFEAALEIDILIDMRDSGVPDLTNIWEDAEVPLPSDEPCPIISSDLAKELRALKAERDDEEAERLAHVGNGIPCKHHNLKLLGCAKGAGCPYSHAPDERSIADSEGRNVCLYFLMGSCKFGEGCLYLHSKANLPHLKDQEDFPPGLVRRLISVNEQGIAEQRLFSNFMGVGPTALGQEKSRTGKVEQLSRSSKPFVMHLTLNKSTQLPIKTMEALRKKVEVARASTKAKARDFLVLPSIKGVFITDAPIVTPNNSGLLVRLVSYVENGGTVVIGGSFKMFSKNSMEDIRRPSLNKFFDEAWGLPWKLSAMAGTENQKLVLNGSHELASGLPKNLSLTGGMWLTGVAAHEALYVEQSSGQRAAAAIAQVGSGRFGFICEGAENGLGAGAIVIAMLGL